MNASYPGEPNFPSGAVKPAAVPGQLEFSTEFMVSSGKLHSQSTGKATPPEHANVQRTGANVDWMDIASVEPAPRQGANPAATVSTPQPDSSRAAVLVERIQQMISHEVAHVKRMDADSLSVVIKPDGRTEFLLQVVRRDGQLEASIRMERGDLQQFQNHWGQLQESLAKQNVRLIPWKEPEGTEADSSALSADSGEGQGSPNHHPSRRQAFFHHMDGEDFPSHPDLSKPRPSVSGGRLSHSPLRGWESWA